MYNNSANTKFTGKSIHFLPSCHSTNTVASELVRSKSAVNGLIVITNEQTAGRGQQGNTWLSTPNLNLTFSAIFFPDSYPIADSFYLNIISSLAVVETLEKLLPANKQVYVKWPNDIYIENKKVSGILIENTLRGDKINSVVMGIGINVNQVLFDLPQATSVMQETGVEINLQELFDKLCEHIEMFYLQLNAGLKHELLNLYQSKLYALNTLHAYQDEEGDFMGYIRSIEENGTLLMEKESGAKRKYQFKEVRFIFR
ncbi:biotin--[acetyl-CoA-carboxylase] ligase [Cytophaga aurantiaca]|uniref:biotin--[acetyl-CoA-carboxylase] ligase n=1 Tax=Cytophaga aurantiaca TaxID=29530 RepID=UPI0003637EAD|nr:biotin--[acetyl-CoA-carboxylase] ligase [Cytophaga aurantiaca]